MGVAAVGVGKRWMFLREIEGRPYLVVRYWDSEAKKRRETMSPVDPKEIRRIAAQLDRHRKLEARSTEIPCFNPDCSRRIRTTPSQKRDFLISFKLKYDKVVLPTCSKECREKLLALLS